MARLSTQTVEAMQQKIDAACANPNTGIPGAVCVVVGKDGKEQFAYAGGTRGHGSSEPMTLDSIFWIASCTKMIVGIACMQLVEQHRLALDDAQQVEQLCPELAQVQVLQDDGTLVPKTRGITLRMLLTHTAGFGYTFFNSKLREHSLPAGFDEFSGDVADIMQPLVHQPGEGWAYGVNIDWAGILLERVTQMSLNDYLQQHVFQPLGLDNISMLPTPSMKARLALMNQRWPDGTVTSRNHLLRRPLVMKAGDQCLQSGGAGCFAQPQQYCQILATLLNDGTSPTTGRQLLQAATVEEMFRNQIPELPNFGRQGIPAAKADLTHPLPDLYPSETPQGWGLTFMISGGATGRSAGTGMWAGLANLYWWCDRAHGVAGMVCTQILPYADPAVVGLWVELEAMVYGGLA